MVLMMTVFPGFGGQAFIPDVLPKIEEVRKRIDQSRLAILVEVDGGIKTDNIDRVCRAGGRSHRFGFRHFQDTQLHRHDPANA